MPIITIASGVAVLEQGHGTSETKTWGTASSLISREIPGIKLIFGINLNAVESFFPKTSKQYANIVSYLIPKHLKNKYLKWYTNYFKPQPFELCTEIFRYFIITVLSNIDHWKKQQRKYMDECNSEKIDENIKFRRISKYANESIVDARIVIDKNTSEIDNFPASKFNLKEYQLEPQYEFGLNSLIKIVSNIEKGFVTTEFSLSEDWTSQLQAKKE